MDIERLIERVTIELNFRNRTTFGFFFGSGLYKEEEIS